MASSLLGDATINTAGADWLLKLIKDAGTTEEMLNRCNVSLYKTAMHVLENGTKSNGTGRYTAIAIDKHKIPRYDKNANMKYMIYSKPERGTKRFETYMTVKLVASSKKMTAGPTLGCSIVTRGDDNDDLVRKMLQKCDDLGLHDRLVLLDREFYAVDVMEQIRMSGRSFVMPVPKSTVVQKMLSEYDKKIRKPASLYAVKSTSGSFEYTLVIVPSSKHKKSDDICERYHAFATNLNIRDAAKLVEVIPQEYRQRWDIESGYRVVEQRRAHTTSKNSTIRIVLFYYTLMLCNAWLAHRWLHDDSPIRPSYTKNGRGAISMLRFTVMVLNYIIKQHGNLAHCEPD